MASRLGRSEGDSATETAADLQPNIAADVPQEPAPDRGAALDRDATSLAREHGDGSERAAAQALSLLDGLRDRGMLARVRILKIGDLELHLEPGFEHEQETEAQRAERERIERDYLTYGAST